MSPRAVLSVGIAVALPLSAGCFRLGKDAYGRLPHGVGARNVRDFGARGDGITDDSQAIIRALTVSQA